MFVKGTDKIRGVLDLPTLKQQVTKGATVYIDDKNKYSHDIQTALHMGYVQLVQSQNPNLNEEHDNDFITCRNIHTRSISVPGIQSEILSGQTFRIPEEELHSSAIRASISKGLLEIIHSPTNEEIDEEEAFVEVSSKLNLDLPDNMTPAQKSLYEAMVKNQAKTEKELETNEELSTLRVIDTETPDPITKKDIPDPKKSSIVFNPTGETQIHAMKDAVISTGNKKEPFLKTASRSKKTELSKAVKTNPDATPITETQDELPKSDPKKNTVVVSPLGDSVANKSKQNMVWLNAKTTESQVKAAAKADEISFVDQEEEAKRREQHPVLRKKAPEVSSEPVMIDPDTEQKKRREKHPVLSKKSQDNKADMF